MIKYLYESGRDLIDYISSALYIVIDNSLSDDLSAYQHWWFNIDFIFRLEPNYVRLKPSTAVAYQSNCTQDVFS